MNLSQIKNLYPQIQEINPKDITDFFPNIIKNKTLVELINDAKKLTPEMKHTTKTADLSRFTKTKLNVVLKKYEIEELSVKNNQNEKYLEDYKKSQSIIKIVFNYAHAVSLIANDL